MLTHDPARGEWRAGAIRYMMIRPDALMGLFAELPPEMRGAALAALGRSVRRHGGKSARSYQAGGAATPAALLATITETAAELGWGLWDLRHDGEELVLAVSNSPFVAGAGPGPHPVCAPIAGMLAALAELVFAGDIPAVSGEHACAATGAACCRFTARRAAPPVATAAAPDR
jgi:hypothetical protein